MLACIVQIVFSALVVLAVLSECSWVQPKNSRLAFLALVYAWYATTTIWAANTKKIEKGIIAEGVHLYPSASFWLTLFPQVLSCICITAIAGGRKLTAKIAKSTVDSTEGLGQACWYAAGAGFFFGQLFTVEGLGAGAPGLVFGVKVLEPLSTSLLAIPVLGQRLNWRLLVAVMVACSGILLCVVGAHRGAPSKGGDFNEWKVIVGAILANLGFSSRACVMKKAYSQRSISPLETFFKVNVVAGACGVLMLIVWAIYLATCPERFVYFANVFHQLAAKPWKWFATCLCYFLYQCSSILLLDCLLVETHALLVALKHIFVVILASIMSGSPINTLMIIGIVVASLGVFAYSVSPGDTEARTSLLPPNEKKVKPSSGIPLVLCFLLSGLGVLGILSPFLYV